MRSFRLAVFATLLLLASCTGGARLDVTVPSAPGSQLVVRRLDVNTYVLVDSVKTDSRGHMSCKVKVAEGQPEFVYVFYKDRRIASLLLQSGDVVSVTADTLGKYKVQGSPESDKLAAVEAAASRFGAAMSSTMNPAELSRIYIAHYRESVKYVLANQRSLTVIPVLFEQLDEITPLFSRHTDAILFRQTADTLKTVYPESAFVKALDKEATKRENALQLHNMIDTAEELGYPDITLPGVDGQPVTLSEVDSKAVLVHFWSSTDASQKMFNLDVLLPLWNKWHDKGLEIYAVDVNSDKAVWASVLRAQKLPWINVNGGIGTIQAVSLYNISELPASFLLVDGTLSSASITGSAALSKELSRVLK